MRLVSFLPPDRYAAGTLAVIEADQVLYGPVWARGEADNTAAAAHGNAREDPTRPYGDHPAGVYRIANVVDVELARHATYGPWFIALDPVDGEALDAKRAGRTGLGIHAGRRHADGRLRETYGCLRLDEGALRELVTLVRPRLVDQRVVLYECRLVG